MASVAPQQTVTFFSGSRLNPLNRAVFSAMALRRFLAPHVIAYWFTLSLIALRAASFISSGAEKSGNPWDKLIPLWSWQSRVISRMTDSVNCSAFFEIFGIPFLL